MRSDIQCECSKRIT